MTRHDLIVDWVQTSNRMNERIRYGLATDWPVGTIGEARVRLHDAILTALGDFPSWMVAMVGWLSQFLGRWRR